MATVLVVEDEATVLFLVESALSEHGHATVTAASAEEALALIVSDQPIDALFTDIDLGGGNGLEVAELFRETYPSGTVLYATGAAITDGMRARMVPGAEIMAKPYRIPELVDALERLLSGGASEPAPND